MEEWRPVVGYENLYNVSNQGRMMSLKCGRSKIMKTPNNSKGYAQVCLMKDNSKLVHRVHRLVAKAFLEENPTKKEIDHIDRNRSNNRVENLRYADRTEQMINRGSFSNSGHKNISQHKRSGWFHVVIRRYGQLYMNLACSSLEEAIFQRDAYLSTE